LIKQGKLINIIFSIMQKEMLYTCSMLQAAAILMLQVSEGHKV
jgi:hypothetical protein